MGDNTHLTVDDYQVLSDALLDYVDSIQRLIEVYSRESGDFCKEIGEYNKLLTQVRNTKRKVRRRLGRQIKLVVPDVVEVVQRVQPPSVYQGDYFHMDVEKLEEVQLIVGYSNCPAPDVAEFLLNTDRRTLDNHHQRFLDDSSAADIAEWFKFVYFVD